MKLPKINRCDKKLRRIKVRSPLALGLVALAAVIFDPRPSSAHVGGILAEPINWQLPQVSISYNFSYPLLGNGGFRTELSMRVVEDRLCAIGGALGFDIDDSYAFDIDESVELTLTYAPAYSGTFNVFWDANGGEGVGQKEVQVEPGAPLRQVTLTLDRARFAGQGSRGIDIAVSGREDVAICDFQLARSNTTPEPGNTGRVQLTITDAATGESVPARVGLHDSSGRLPLPNDQAVQVGRFGDTVRRLLVKQTDPLWPSDNRQVFYVNGEYGADVAPGSYELLVTRGVEYEPYIASIEVVAGETADVRVELNRYADLASRGWYSLDGHVHLPRPTVDDQDAWAFGAAEDVRILNVTQMGNLSRTHFNQPAWGPEGIYEKNGYFVMPNIEDPRTVQHGHTLHFNLSQSIRLPTDRYYFYHEIFEEVRQLGGITGYAHRGQLFNGRRGLALDVPFGIIDFIELLQQGQLATEPWYDFLNLGYNIRPMAGSDFPYMDLPGAVRAYAHVDGEFTTDKWFEAFRNGQVYVTTGPFLELTVNGQPMGSEIQVNRGERLEIVAVVELNPAVDELEQLELVVFGDVVATQNANGSDRIEFRTELVADQSHWLAVRANGVSEGDRDGPLAVAHTAATWIVVDGEPAVKQEGLADLVQLHRSRLSDFRNDFVDPRGDLEPWETADLMELEWERQLMELESRITEADARYLDFLEPR